MKRTYFLLATLICMSLNINADKVNNRSYNEALQYFRDCSTNPNAELPASALKHAGDSKSVWKAWQQVMSETAENTLPALAPLSDNAKGVWSIPDSLEPNVSLNFYYGTKGEAESLPLYVYLHGSGPREYEWATGLKLCQNFDDAPSAYFIPQIPQEGQWYRWYQQSKQWFLERLLKLGLARDNIDASRIYFFGISEGGYGSQRLASFYADYLAGAGPMAGGEPLKNAPAENCSNIAFSLLTGAKDFGFYRNKLTGHTKDALDSLQALFPNEYNHRVELIEGMGHGIDYSLTTKWLKQFKRNPYPKHFIWEDYEMHGRHRKGFYNLVVDKRPSDDVNQRTRYDVDIQGNTVNITMQDITYTCTELDPHWGIELQFKREYAQSTSGQFTLFLNEELVNIKQPVTVILNGKTAFKGKVKPSSSAMLKSLATFGDPLRIFPVSVQLEVK